MHRIGRTGRAGASGRSLALLCSKDDRDCEFAPRLVKVRRGDGPPPFYAAYHEPLRLTQSLLT